MLVESKPEKCESDKSRRACPETDQCEHSHYYENERYKGRKRSEAPGKGEFGPEDRLEISGGNEAESGRDAHHNRRKTLEPRKYRIETGFKKMKDGNEKYRAH